MLPGSRVDKAAGLKQWDLWGTLLPLLCDVFVAISYFSSPYEAIRLKLYIRIERCFADVRHSIVCKCRSQQEVLEKEMQDSSGPKIYGHTIVCRMFSLKFRRLHR